MSLITVAIDNPEFRRYILDILDSNGFHATVLSRSDDLRQTNITAPVLLETNDDVAALNQIVYKAYKTSGEDSTLPIIAFLSEYACEQNPRIGAWDIDGHAAVMAVVPKESDWFAESLISFLRRLMR